MTMMMPPHPLSLMSEIIPKRIATKTCETPMMPIACRAKGVLVPLASSSNTLSGFVMCCRKRAGGTIDGWEGKNGKEGHTKRKEGRV